VIRARPRKAPERLVIRQVVRSGSTRPWQAWAGRALSRPPAGRPRVPIVPVERCATEAERPPPAVETVPEGGNPCGTTPVTVATWAGVILTGHPREAIFLCPLFVSFVCINWTGTVDATRLRPLEPR